MPELQVKHALLRQLVANGVEVIFGNPGTFEQGLLDVLGEYPQLRYVMGLQEAAVLAMATNYARVGRRCAVVQLHAKVGLGNAAGALQDAVRGKTPMIVICGENTTDWEAFDGFLAGDITRLATPASKWAIKISSSDHFLNLFHRAWVCANTPPRGPVVLSLPMELLERPVRGLPAATVLPGGPGLPEPADIEQISGWLRAAKNPLVLVGDALAWADAQEQALKLAALLNAPLRGLGMTMVGNLLAHPWFAGVLRNVQGESVAQVTRAHDLILTVGVTLGCEMFPQPENDYLRPGARLIQVDPNPLDIGKNVRPSLALMTDPKATLAAIVGRLEAEGQRPHSAPSRRGPTPSPSSGKFTAEEMMNTLAAEIPKGAYVVDEAMTASDFLREALSHRPDVEYQSCLTPGLGSGWPAGISAKLIHPERRVISVSADGAAMYVAVSLWTAAHLNLDTIFLTVNNHAYQILKYNLDAYWGWTNQPSKSYPPMMDLAPPEIRFDLLAESMGLTGLRATDAHSLREAIRHAASLRGPSLIDVIVT